jgi:signal transduction histidine kinase
MWQLGNRKAVTDNAIWQPWLIKNAPLTGALLFGVLLSALTIWFTGGSLGAWLTFSVLGLALVSLGFLPETALRLVLPLLLGLGALLTLLFTGGQSSPAISAVLWPVLGLAALGSPNLKGQTRGWIGPAIMAGFGVLISVIVIERFVALPPSTFVALPLAIGAMGTCAGFAIAAIVRAGRPVTQSGAMPAEDVMRLTKGRDAALQEANRARSENQERAQFMAEMSHEIRTPLNAILGFADTMRSQIFGPLPKQYGDYPDLIHSSGSHLLDIVSDLLDLSKIEAGRYETRMMPVALDGLAREGVAMAAGSARSAGVIVREDVEQPIMVLGDARAVRQIIFNLVSNGIKFTPTGGHVVVRVLPGSAPHTAILQVEDNGVGMSEADLARIGQPWNQVSDAASDQAGKRTRGSGLGLALVKRLADLQGAQFELASVLGSGTKASVTFQTAHHDDGQSGAGD